MGGFSDFAELETLDLYFGRTAYTAPATYYISLHTSTPGDTGANEMTAANYARKSYANNTTNFPDATGTAGTKQNAVAITFLAATATWGTATHFALWDATAAGNMIFWGTLSTAKSIGTSDQAKININGMTLTIG